MRNQPSESDARLQSRWQGGYPHATARFAETRERYRCEGQPQDNKLKIFQTILVLCPRQSLQTARHRHILLSSFGLFAVHFSFLFLISADAKLLQVCVRSVCTLSWIVVEGIQSTASSQNGSPRCRSIFYFSYRCEGYTSYASSISDNLQFAFGLSQFEKPRKCRSTSINRLTQKLIAGRTKCEDGTLFLGDGSLAGVPTPKLGQKGIRPVIKVVDDKCL